MSEEGRPMIIQIIPVATPLYARFESRPDEPDIVTPVIALALVEEMIHDEPYRHVVGVEWLDDEICLVTGSSNFIGYTDKPGKPKIK